MPEDFIRVEASSKEGAFDLIGRMPDKAKRLLRDAIDDIADRIEQEVDERVPVDTGELKMHPVERRDFRRRVAGPGGLVTKTEFTLPRGKARWVHDGTGVYGPRGTPIVPRKAKFMVFYIDGIKFVRRSVLGQEPQPYLREALENVEATYIPIRLTELKAELELLL